jgi:hypothetical protein
MEDRDQASAVAAAAQPKHVADLLMGHAHEGWVVMRVGVARESGYACRIMLIVGLNHTLYVSLERQRARQTGHKAARGKRWALLFDYSGTIGVF